MAAHNQNEPSLKNSWIPQILYYIYIFLHCINFKWFIIVLLPSTSRAMKEEDIALLTLGYLLHYLGLWLLMYTCSVWKRDDFRSVTPFYQEANPCPYRLREFISKRRFNAINIELSILTLTPHPMLISFGKYARW